MKNCCNYLHQKKYLILVSHNFNHLFITTTAVIIVVVIIIIKDFAIFIIIITVIKANSIIIIESFICFLKFKKFIILPYFINFKCYFMKMFLLLNLEFNLSIIFINMPNTIVILFSIFLKNYINKLIKKKYK